MVLRADADFIWHLKILAEQVWVKFSVKVNDWYQVSKYLKGSLLRKYSSGNKWLGRNDMDTPMCGLRLLVLLAAVLRFLIHKKKPKNKTEYASLSYAFPNA